MVRRALSALVGFALWAMPGPVIAADGISVNAVGLSILGDASAGPFLEWRGSLTLSSGAEKFGGFSGLLLSDDCRRLTAIGDDGWWMSAGLTYAGEADQLTDVTAMELHPMLARTGKRGTSKTARDAEALTLLDDGTLAVGFESRPRIEAFNFRRGGYAARPVTIPLPKAIAQGPENGEMEALGFAREGRLAGKFLAIAENNLDEKGAARAWVWRPQGMAVVDFAIELPSGYRATDLAFLPGGQEALVLVRAFFPGLTGMGIARLRLDEIAPGKTITPEILFQARQPMHIIDNMEGIAVCRHKGETRITVISDDNYLAGLQRTILIQFALTRP